MFWRGLLRICEAAVNLVTVCILLLWSSLGAYALWDNNQVLNEAEDVRSQLLQWKPVAAEEAEEPVDNALVFAQLRKINPDVRGWITMEGTAIDFPVVRGENNLHYISRDVFGEFSLAGSIFLDSRDDPAFSQSYALLYGHHMADGNMFGDLDRYKEEAFFRDHEGGQLILPDKAYGLRVLGCLVVGASDGNIFDPEAVRRHPERLLPYVRENSLWFREPVEGTGQYLALSTCSEEFTDARTVVLTQMLSMEQEGKET